MLPEVQYTSGNTCSWRWFGLNNWITVWTEITQVPVSVFNVSRLSILLDFMLFFSTQGQYKYELRIFMPRHWQTNPWTLLAKCICFYNQPTKTNTKTLPKPNQPKHKSFGFSVGRDFHTDMVSHHSYTVSRWRQEDSQADARLFGRQRYMLRNRKISSIFERPKEIRKVNSK